MPMNIGASPITAMMVGPDEVSAAYLGPDLVWSRTLIYQTFDVADLNNLTSLGWVHYGPTNSIQIGVVNQKARYAVPDGPGTLALFTDYVRYADHVAPADNGHIQFKVATVGDSNPPSGDNLITDVFGRGSNTAASHGVGFRMQNSSLSIVRRVGGSDAVVKSLGSFAAGDVLRLDFNGNLHTATRNGDFVGEWNDTGATASKGAGFRSLLMRMNGHKAISGQRRFSPSIDYVEYG